jgi:hypothetical protein
MYLLFDNVCVFLLRIIQNWSVGYELGKDILDMTVKKIPRCKAWYRIYLSKGNYRLASANSSTSFISLT